MSRVSEIAAEAAVTVYAKHTFDQQKCWHLNTGYVRLRTSNGIDQIRWGCLECGRLDGASYKFADHPQRQTYPIFVRHPSPCDCHDYAPLSQHRRWDRVDYDSYIASEQWSDRRCYAIRRALNRCQMCGWLAGPGGNGLDVHHRSYHRLGAEFDIDLIVLCRPCHERHHTPGAA